MGGGRGRRDSFLRLRGFFLTEIVNPMWNPFFPDWRNANLERTEVDISFFFSLLFLLSSNEIARLVIISIFRHWRRLNEQEKFRRFRWLIVILLRRIFERKSEVRNKLAEESMIFNWHICLRWKEMKIWLKLFWHKWQWKK